jgi:peroxiredoxin
VGDYPSDALQPGTAAPDFQLKSTPDQSVRLADFRGRALIMAFYPADWSPVCTDRMALYNEILPEFRNLGAQLVGISIDHA